MSGRFILCSISSGAALAFMDTMVLCQYTVYFRRILYDLIRIFRRAPLQRPHR